MTTQPAKLIPLSVTVRGEVVASNLTEFHAQVTEALSLINYSPSSDEDFAKAEDLIKGLKAIEESVTASRERALAGAADLNNTLKEMFAVEDKLASARLRLTKIVKDRKEAVRGEVIATALLMIPHPKRGVYKPRLEEAMKGKSSLLKIKQALDGAVATIKDEIIAARVILGEFEAEHGADLIAEREYLEISDPTALLDKLSARLTEKRLRDEAAKARAEAAALRATPAPAPQPAPPPQKKTASVPPVPPNRNGGASAEWAKFRESVILMADQLKASLGLLTDPVNQRRAAVFSKRLNEAWQECGKIIAP